MEQQQLTEKEAEEIVRQFAAGQHNMHSFLTNVVTSDDTTKTGNVSQEELGYSSLPVRTYKELALFCNDIADDDGWGDYFNKMSEIQTSTSLSKEGFLMKIANTIKKELADVTKRTKKNSGWFKGKNQEQNQPQSQM